VKRRFNAAARLEKGHGYWIRVEPDIDTIDLGLDPD